MAVTLIPCCQSHFRRRLQTDVDIVICKLRPYLLITHLNAASRFLIQPVQISLCIMHFRLNFIQITAYRLSYHLSGLLCDTACAKICMNTLSFAIIHYVKNVQNIFSISYTFIIISYAIMSNAYIACFTMPKRHLFSLYSSSRCKLPKCHIFHNPCSSLILFQEALPHPSRSQYIHALRLHPQPLLAPCR